MVTSTKIRKEMYSDYSGFFSGSGFFKGKFSLVVKGVKAYQPHPVAFALHESFKKELECL